MAQLNSCTEISDFKDFKTKKNIEPNIDITTIEIMPKKVLSKNIMNLKLVF